MSDDSKKSEKINWFAEVRGLFPARLPFPPGPDREEQLTALRAWLEGWLPRLARLG